MNSSEVVRYRKMLDIKYGELIASHHSPDELAIERVADAMDEVVFANERDLLVDTLNRQVVLLSHVLEALRRTQDGSFGVCVQCSGPISEKRLNALPWAALCLPCQERADDRGRPQFIRSLRNAA
jgi:DnaK suppressor protein